MDKQLLNALDNLSEALVMISEALEKKGGSNTATTNALQSGDFSKQINQINVGIKSIKSDTQEILKNQKTILGISKSEKKTPLEEAGVDKKKESSIKQGVGTILLIAVAVLAIGLAFKIVGSIDFVSVIGLSLAMVLVSIAFEKIAKLNIPLKKGAETAAIMVIMSLGITMSSWILKAVTPVSFFQATTAILIAGMFTVMAFGIGKLINALGGAGIIALGKSILFLPLILPAIALAITVSSWVLQLVTPISFFQAVTGILIAGMFAVVANGLGKILTALGKIKNPADILLLPILLPAIALGVTISSWILSAIVPLSFGQSITAILIGAMFAVISFGIAKTLAALGKTNPAAILLLPIVFVAISLAIALSAEIFNNYAKEIENVTFGMMLNVLMIGAAIGLTMVIVSMAMKIMGDISLGQVIKVPILFTLIALAIAGSAAIMYNAQEYINGITFGSIFKLLVFSVALAISVAVVALAFAVVNGLGNITDYLKGGLSILVIAGTIALASMILSKGEYGIYPDWKWAVGVGLSLVAFGAAALVLGTFATTGIGAIALIAGAAATLLVAGTIIAASHILAEGNYSKYPTLDWALGVGLSMGGFGLAMGTLGMFIVGSLGIGMIALEAGSKAISIIAQSIVNAGAILSKGTFTGGPTKRWAQGISLAIGAFAPVYSSIMNSGFFGKKVSADDMVNAIKTISQGIVSTAEFFANNTAVFDPSKAPSAEWGRNVGAALGAFAPVFTALSGSGFWTSGEKIVNSIHKGIMKTAQAIVNVATGFAKVPKKVWESYPKIEWVDSMKSTFEGFIGITNSVKEFNFSEMNSVPRMSSRLVDVARIIHSGSKFFSTKMDPNYIKNLSSNLLGFAKLAKSLTDMNKGAGAVKTLFGLDPVSQTANSMVKLASAYDKLATSLKKFGGALQSIDGDKVGLIRRLTGNLAVLASMNESALNTMMETLESKASVFSSLVDVGKKEGPTVGATKGGKKPGEKLISSGAKYGDTNQQLDIVIDLLTNINNSTSSLDEYLADKGFRTEPVTNLGM